MKLPVYSKVEADTPADAPKQRDQKPKQKKQEQARGPATVTILPDTVDQLLKKLSPEAQSRLRSVYVTDPQRVFLSNAMIKTKGLEKYASRMQMWGLTYNSLVIMSNVLVPVAISLGSMFDGSFGQGMTIAAIIISLIGSLAYSVEAWWKNYELGTRMYKTLNNIQCEWDQFEALTGDYSPGGAAEEKETIGAITVPDLSGVPITILEQIVKERRAEEKEEEESQQASKAEDLVAKHSGRAFQLFSQRFATLLETATNDSYTNSELKSSG